MMAPGFPGGLLLEHPQTFREIMGGGGRQAEEELGRSVSK